MDRGWREVCPNCPRCGSTNTKFCYYNNYSLTQPRYFCKGCRRYWTKGGSLRNVPVGGGCRKSQRSRSSSSLRLATTTNNHHLNGGNTNVMFGLGGNIGASSTNNHLGHNSYGTNIMVESNNSPPSNSKPPTIDLAMVYANFLNKKPDNNDDNAIQLPHINKEFEEQSIELRTKLHVSSHSSPNLLGMQQQQQQHDPRIVGCAKDISLPYIGNENKDHDHNNQTFIKEFSTSTYHPNQDHITSMQHGLGLPPLPGESSSSWASLSCHDNNLIANVQAPLRPPGSNPNPDPYHQFSNLFVGNWSPLDLPSFETSSSSSMP